MTDALKDYVPLLVIGVFVVLLAVAERIGRGPRE